MATRRIGEILVAEGLLTEGAVQRALGFQRLSTEHIKLGSILLNWDLLAEDALLSALGRVHRCPPVSWSVLSAAPVPTVRLLPAAQAIRFGAMPYEAGGGFVRVAFINPGDLAAVDEVGRIVGRRVLAGVATEIRMLQAHQRFYGRHVPLELRAIMQKIDRKSGVTRRIPGFESSPADVIAADVRPPLQPTPAPVEIEISAARPHHGPPPDRPGGAVPIPERHSPDLPVGDVEKPEVFSGEDSLSKWLEDALSAFRDPAWNPARPSTRVTPPPAAAPGVAARASTRAPEPPVRDVPRPADPSGSPDPVRDMWQAAPPAESDSAVSRMWTSEPPHALAVGPAISRYELVEGVIESVLVDIPRVVVLGIERDSITGWRGKGPDVTQDRVISLRIPLRDRTVFTMVLSADRPHCGPVERDLWPAALAALLGSEPPDCAVFPVRIGRSPVAFLYGDRIDRPLQREDIARLARAADAMAGVLIGAPLRSSAARS